MEDEHPDEVVLPSANFVLGTTAIRAGTANRKAPQRLYGIGYPPSCDHLAHWVRARISVEDTQLG